MFRKNHSARPSRQLKRSRRSRLAKRFKMCRHCRIEICVEFGRAGMNTVSKHFVKRTLLHRFSRRQLWLLMGSLLGILFILLFLPYWISMGRWVFHKRVDFEGDSISVPTGWTSGEEGHLFSLRRPGSTILLPHEDTIVIDSFAEHWPSEDLKMVSDRWLRFHGSPVADRFRDFDSGRPIEFDRTAKCVSTASPSQGREIQIYCLTFDSVHSVEFVGDRNAVSEFADVLAQAVRIADRHPGTIVRR